MGTCITILGLSSILLLFIGLVKPQISLFWYSGNRTWWTSLLIYGASWLVLAAISTELENTPSALGAKTSQDNIDPNIIVSDGYQSAPAIKDKTGETPKASEADIAKAKILTKLKAAAKRDWPNDYSTQEYWINQQLDAYEEMLQIPDDPIKIQAQRDWPLDFSTQRYWYNQQLEARARLNNN